MRHHGLLHRGILFSAFLVGFSYIIPVLSDFPEYGTNPFSFEIAEVPCGDATWWPGWGDDFLVADVNDDGVIDYLFRSETKLYAYAHDGSPMWSPITIQCPTGNGGARFGAADVDGDGQTEIVAINAGDSVYPIYIYDGSSGAFERKREVPGLQPYQKVGHIVVANLQSNGDRYAIVQTVDVNSESTIEYYINRSVIALDLNTGAVLWRQDQNRTYPPYYEGYWGTAHGPLMIADVDFDGKDEIIGGSFVDHDGTLNHLNYQNASSWIYHNSGYVDHLDGIAVGDFDPARRGLEWVVLEEDGVGYANYNTVYFSWQGLQPVWKKMALSLWKLTPDFPTTTDYRDLEPQNLAVGNFDLSVTGKEFWNRSRMGRYTTPTISQHPWVYDQSGNLITHFRMDDVLPTSPAFNSLDNNEGVEMIWTIDWDGSGKEYIAAKARHVQGEVGVFDAMDMTPAWYTSHDFPSVQAHFIYVADVAGDSREEVIVCDQSVSPPQIRVYWNEADNPNPPKQCKWDDPLYRRLKQNWNYYSPGSYTRPAPAILQLQVFLEGPYVAAGDTMRTALLEDGVIPLQSPYSEDPISVDAIPDAVTDWILLELRQTPDGSSVLSRSLFLKNDGTVLDIDGYDAGVSLFAFRGVYYLVVRHRNHLGVMSAEPVRLAADSTSTYDFTTGLSMYYDERAKLLETGVYGLYTGDANSDGQVKVDDKNDYWWIQVGRAGYWSGDFSLDGQVKVDDKNDFWWKNVGIGSQVP